MDVIIVSPEPGREKEIGQRLLAVANHPNQVQWVTWPTAGFSVPIELLARMEEDGKGNLSGSTVFDDTPDTPLPEPKKRGRPRKTAVENTDDNPEKEE